MNGADKCPPTIKLCNIRTEKNKLERENDNRTPLDRVTVEFMRNMMDSDNAGTSGGFSPSIVDGLPLAMVYAPMQKWRQAYSPDEALVRGTMFAELDKPFYPPKICGGNKNGK